MSLAEIQDAVETAKASLVAHQQFFEEVAGVAIDMAERGDPTCLRLLTAMKDLQARTGEFVTNGED